MTIATKNRQGAMGPEQVKTLEKAVTTDGQQTITGPKVVTIGAAATAATYVSFFPSDRGPGKPELKIVKTSTIGKWNLEVDDGASNTGAIINFQTPTLTWNDVAFARVDGPVFTLPPRLPSYTVATLPSAATYVRGLIYVSDGTGSKRLAISDGTNWRFPDGAIVS